VQCKRWDSRLVGVDEIREFAGTLMREGMTGRDGLFVALSDYTHSARQEAARLKMTVLTGADLYSRLEKLRKPEPCPTCGQPMVLGVSTRGWWFRCVAPGCAGKRDLGNEPGRAVELLTR
jgi:hypothetical protein